MAEVLEQLAKELFAGNAYKGVAELTNKALAEGLKPSRVLNSGLIKGMSEVGVKFKANEIYVPEGINCCSCHESWYGNFKTKSSRKWSRAGSKNDHRNGKGSLHDIGKNLVAMMMEGAGFEIIDLEVSMSRLKNLSRQ